MTNKEIDKILKEKLGITKWTKWQARLERRINNLLVVMGLYLIICGIGSLGWKGLLINTLMFATIETTLAIIRHIYYGAKRKLRDIKKKKQTKS